MSARLDLVSCTERQTLPIPFGHHVYVVSDLSLSPATDIDSRPVRELITLLGDIDDAAVVVVAGNLFHPEATSDLVKFVDATLRALPALRDQIVAFTANERHRFIVLPGSEDKELHHNQPACERLEQLGVAVASDLILQVATASGVRDLAVAAGCVPSTPSERTRVTAPTPRVSKTRTHCRDSSRLGCCIADSAAGCGFR